MKYLKLIPNFSSFHSFYKEKNVVVWVEFYYGFQTKTDTIVEFKIQKNILLYKRRVQNCLGITDNPDSFKA